MAIINEWVLLIYKIPTQPTRLRLHVWRRLQRMGAIYLQNAAVLLPARADLVENMHYVAGEIEEMGGVCYLFSASSLLPGGVERLVGEFRTAADRAHAEIGARIDAIALKLVGATGPEMVAEAEQELKRERTAALRARRLAYFGGDMTSDVDDKLERLKREIENNYRTCE
jgi:hypothetical protein